MERTSENRPDNQHRKYVSIGLLAHVDAGKTTLAESIMYLSGSIRKLGRVDHRDTFLDTHELERSRGITIFAKQAVFDLGQVKATLLDTPGHADFSAEMERTLQVLDCAVLVVSGPDGVQGHTRTLWNLLKRYEIPTFLFINKMDQAGTDRGKLLAELKRRLDENCIAFDVSKEGDEGEAFWESAAVCDETALEEYLSLGSLADSTLSRLIERRKLFPCYFGSALKLQGVGELLADLENYAGKFVGTASENTGEFGAKVFKISRDAKGARLTHLKITSGKLKVKDVLKGGGGASSCWEEKVNEIRIYSGEKYEQAQEIRAGTVCAVTGLSSTYPGEGLGIEKKSEAPALEPVLNYQVKLPPGCDVHVMLKNFRQLEEEDPMLRVVWEEELGEIHVQLMGEVQTEVLKDVVSRRFGVEVTFDACGIVYKETIGKTAEGVGHFEPLRHYAEVHLILEPGKRGSGLVFESDVSEDVLDRNWQRLILAHLAEKTHRGVLIGAPLTDVKITLAAGRAHLKHTEGGDFREATYRAVRQGLMQAESILLEPYYEFQLEVPSEFIGRAITDIQRMAGEFGQPVTDGEMSEISGSVPVAAMRGYQREVAGYTKGQGRLSCIFKGYEVCQNAEEVIEQSGYDPELDSDNPAGSVFCDHGAGFYVPWNKVSEYMHIGSQLKKRKREAPRKLSAASRQERGRKGRTGLEVSGDDSEDGELEEIFIRTYGRVERRRSPSRIVPSKAKLERKKEGEAVREYLLVDGYNIIYAWEELKALAEEHIEAARNKLVDILCNYQGFKKCSVILVFDAYRVEGCELEVQKYGGIYVVYTKEAETADQYIEKVVHQIGKKYQVAVATSDRTEQVITLGQGGRLISAQEFKEEIESAKRQIREACERRRESGKNYLFDHMDEKLAKEMEEVRLGQKKSLTGISERRKR